MEQNILPSHMLTSNKIEIIKTGNLVNTLFDNSYVIDLRNLSLTEADEVLKKIVPDSLRYLIAA